MKNCRVFLVLTSYTIIYVGGINNNITTKFWLGHNSDFVSLRPSGETVHFIQSIPK